MAFDPNEITKLIRDSMNDVDNIKNAVEGNIYSHYINSNSDFPCITNHILGGSLHFANNVCEPIIQSRIWTSNDKNPSGFLYDVYKYIYAEFFNTYKSNSILHLEISMKRLSTLPAVMQESYKNNEIYSLPFNLHCRAIFKT